VASGFILRRRHFLEAYSRPVNLRGTGLVRINKSRMLACIVL
jgi:hypothetical protein